MSRKTTWALFLGALIPNILFAASDGSLGASSTGSATISITLPTKVVVSDVDDLAFGTWDASSATMTQADEVCIFTSNPSGQYRVTLSGDGTGSSFETTDGNSNTLPYKAYWTDTTVTTDLVELSAGVTATGRSNACTASTTCKGGCGNTNALFQVEFTEANLSAVRSGVYAGTLSITVEPE